MLWMTLVTLLTVWGVGVVSAHLFGGLIHVLLIVAIAIVFVRFIQDRAKTAAMTVQAAAIGSELAEGGADLAFAIGYAFYLSLQNFDLSVGSVTGGRPGRAGVGSRRP